MAIGDVQDFVRRLRGALPRRWFPETATDSPVLNGTLTGVAAVWAKLYSLLSYVVTQTRISTATGVFLDMVAQDFFQGRITRFLSEGDSHFRQRVQAEILRPRATRAAIAEALTDLTGIPPVIFEPANTNDTGGYNLGGVGYDVAGGWGDLSMPFQAFITAFEPAGGGVANVSGYGNIDAGIATTGGLGGYGQGAIELADLEMVQGAITTADIYATVAAAMPAATIGWTRGLAATLAQIQVTLLPLSGVTRSVSSAYGSFSTVAGALVSAIGKATSAGRLGLDRVANLATNTLAIGTGALVPQGAVILVQFLARGLATGSARAKALSGSGVLATVSRGAGVGRLKAATTTAGLLAQGAAAGSGNLFPPGANIILPGRGTADAHGTAAISATRALVANSVAKGAGTTTMSLAGGLSMVSRGTARSFGKLTPATQAAGLRSVTRAAANSQTTLSIQQAAPTAPSNVTPSNATPTTVTLTWSPSTGAP